MYLHRYLLEGSVPVPSPVSIETVASADGQCTRA